MTMKLIGPILIVEDDILQQEYLKRLLERLCLDADIAGTKYDAERLLAASVKNGIIYKLILLDIMLPDGTGHELLHRLRTDILYAGYAQSKIIMLTALDELREVAGAFSEKCDAYLTKPIQKERLLSMLQSYRLIE